MTKLIWSSTKKPSRCHFSSYLDGFLGLDDLHILTGRVLLSFQEGIDTYHLAGGEAFTVLLVLRRTKRK